MDSTSGPPPPSYEYDGLAPPPYTESLGVSNMPTPRYDMVIELVAYGCQFEIVKCGQASAWDIETFIPRIPTAAELQFIVTDLRTMRVPDMELESRGLISNDGSISKNLSELELYTNGMPILS